MASDKICPVTNIPFIQCSEEDKSRKHLEAHLYDLIDNGEIVITDPTMTADDVVKDAMSGYIADMN